MRSDHRRSRLRLLRAAASAAGALTLLVACTGVPTSSPPQTVEALNTDSLSRTPSIPPNLGADPRTIVQSFLAANATNTGNHASARAYLTQAARPQWRDTVATIVANDFSVGTYNPTDRTVTVFGRKLGTLSADGIYTPSLLGVGDGGPKVPFPFEIAKVGAQYRIANLPPGLLLTDQQFLDTYQQHVIYFYDLAEDSLVPDVRWSSLDDRAQLAQWLLVQISNGPRPKLQNAVNPDTMPAQADARHITVSLGTPTRIEIPGSGQLDPSVRDRLAAQLAQTLSDTLAGRDMMITDSGVPVRIPAASANQFTADDFTAATGPPAPAAEVYYLSQGRVRDETGRPLPGPLGDGSTQLASVALGRPSPNAATLVAGVSGSGANARLLVGAERTGMHATSLRGALTRPSFAPGRNEVWVGVDSRLFRVTLGNTGPQVDQVPIPAASGGGRIVSLRLSPEGSRLAIVISGAAGSAQLYMGSIVRGAGPVQVDTLDQISPAGVVVTDVAWLDSFKLFAIGYLSGSQDSRTFEAGVDGTEWTTASIGNLPSPPDRVTAAAGSSVWVSAGDYVWKQSGSSWVSPGAAGQTPGTAPVYLE